MGWSCQTVTIAHRCGCYSLSGWCTSRAVKKLQTKTLSLHLETYKEMREYHEWLLFKTISLLLEPTWDGEKGRVLTGVFKGVQSMSIAGDFTSSRIDSSIGITNGARFSWSLCLRLRLRIPGFNASEVIGIKPPWLMLDKEFSSILARSKNSFHLVYSAIIDD